MRRSQADESRRRQAAAERRFRGHRIRGGLDELGDLDAPQEQKQRIEASPVAAEAPPLTKSNTAAVKVESPLLSSSGAVSATVFGPDWAEWVEVKRVLFDTTATVAEKRAALATVSVWRLRARKERQLPPYVEATEVLVDAMLQDEADALADGPQRMCYGAALSRVVHTMTGSFASGSADTYRKRAHEIGFPEEAVEARQRVAHGQLPLTSELRWVCGLTLQYLFAEYWLEQERQLYLMEKVDKAAVVRHRGDVPAAAAAVAQNEKQRKPFSKAKRNASAARAAAAAAAPASAPAPPTVSMDDMKALLADLEDEDAEEAQSASPEKSAVVSATAAGVSVPAVAENKEEMAQKHTCGGWHIS